MAVLDDITLLRYSEDDLSSQEKREVEELLVSNPDAQKNLEMLIRSSKVLESALGHLKDAKPPESIVKRIRESSAGARAPVKKNSAFSRGSWLSIAASLVLAVCRTEVEEASFDDVWKPGFHGFRLLLWKTVFSFRFRCISGRTSA